MNPWVLVAFGAMLLAFFKRDGDANAAEDLKRQLNEAIGALDVAKAEHGSKSQEAIDAKNEVTRLRAELAAFKAGQEAQNPPTPKPKDDPAPIPPTSEPAPIPPTPQPE